MADEKPNPLIDALVDPGNSPQPDPISSPRERRRRPNPADLLGALIGTDNNDDPPPPEEPKPRRKRPVDLFGALIDAVEPHPAPSVEQTQSTEVQRAIALPFTLPEIELMIPIGLRRPAN